jgi:hypothetical protein
MLALSDQQLGTTLRARLSLKCLLVDRKEMMIDF